MLKWKDRKLYAYPVQYIFMLQMGPYSKKYYDYM